MSHFVVAVITEDIRELERLMEPYYEGREVEPYIDMTKQELIDEHKALEKQVPQKVKKYKGLNETACPECGIAFGYYEYDDEKFDYCYNCGQKLDWESEVEEG